MKPLSQKLAQLSVEAKNTEERVSKAQTQARERLDQQRKEARAKAEEALGNVKQHVNSFKGETRAGFDALQAKVQVDVDNMKQQASEDRARFKSWQANNYANDKEADAEAAIDYAIAATRIAELQTLDAISARAEAEVKAAQIEMPQPATI